MLRYTDATELYREMKDIRLMQKALGHAPLSTAMMYTHIVDDDMGTTIQVLDIQRWGLSNVQDGFDLWGELT